RRADLARLDRHRQSLDRTRGQGRQERNVRLPDAMPARVVPPILLAAQATFFLEPVQIAGPRTLPPSDLSSCERSETASECDLPKSAKRRSPSFVFALVEVKPNRRC